MLDTNQDHTKAEQYNFYAEQTDLIKIAAQRRKCNSNDYHQSNITKPVNASFDHFSFPPKKMPKRGPHSIVAAVGMCSHPQLQWQETCKGYGR